MKRTKYRVVEYSFKGADQEIFTNFKVQIYKRNWFRMKWFNICGYRHPDGSKEPLTFDTKDEAIAFVKRIRTPIPKNVYHYI